MCRQPRTGAIGVPSTGVGGTGPTGVVPAAGPCRSDCDAGFGPANWPPWAALSPCRWPGASARGRKATVAVSGPPAREPARPWRRDRIGSGRADGLPLLQLRYALPGPASWPRYLPRLRHSPTAIRCRSPCPAAGPRRRRHRPGRHPPHHRAQPRPARPARRLHRLRRELAAGRRQGAGRGDRHRRRRRRRPPRRRARPTKPAATCCCSACCRRARPPNCRPPRPPTRPRATNSCTRPRSWASPCTPWRSAAGSTALRRAGAAAPAPSYAGPRRRPSRSTTTAPSAHRDANRSRRGAAPALRVPGDHAPPPPVRPGARRPRLQLHRAVRAGHRQHRARPGPAPESGSGGASSTHRGAPPVAPCRSPCRTTARAAAAPRAVRALLQHRRHQQRVPEQEGVPAVPQRPVAGRLPPQRPHVRRARAVRDMRQRVQVRQQPGPLRQRRPRRAPAPRGRTPTARAAPRRSPNGCGTAADTRPVGTSADTAPATASR